MDNTASKTPLLQQMRASPYWPGFLKTSMVLGLGAVLAGRYGLGEPAAALLANPRFNALVLVMFGAYIALTLLLGTFWSARDGQPLGTRCSSIWAPICLALTAGVLLPTENGISILAQCLLQAVRWGAGMGV